MADIRDKLNKINAEISKIEANMEKEKVKLASLYENRKKEEGSVMLAILYSHDINVNNIDEALEPFKLSKKKETTNEE